MAHSHHHPQPIGPIIHGLAAVSWGIVPVWFYAANRLPSYLTERFQTIALVGGLGLIVLGLFNILTAWEQTSCGHDHGPEDHHPHEDQNPLVTLILMILPVLFALSTTKDQYSEAFLRRKGVFDDNRQSSASFFQNLPPFTRETLEKNTPKNANGDYLMELTQIYWSGSDEEVRSVFEGIPIEVTGKLIDEDEAQNPAQNRMRLYRLFMTCCAADAAVLGIPLEFEGSLPEFPTHAWVQVTGNISYETRDGATSAYIKVRATKSTPDPTRSGNKPFFFR